MRVSHISCGKQHAFFEHAIDADISLEYQLGKVCLKKISARKAMWQIINQLKGASPHTSCRLSHDAQLYQRNIKLHQIDKLLHAVVYFLLR